MSKPKTTLSDKVRRAILDSGLSRYRIAHVAGVEQAALSRFMAGKTNLTLTTVDRMADVLGLDLVARGPSREYPTAKIGRPPKTTKGGRR